VVKVNAPLEEIEVVFALWSCWNISKSRLLGILRKPRVLFEWGIAHNGHTRFFAL
jgi:hypothetical protein